MKTIPHGDKLPALIDALKDRNAEIRAYAVGQLEDVGPDAKAAVPALILLLQEKALRISAAKALAKIGPDARSAAQELVRLLADDEKIVQTTALSALSTFGLDVPVLKALELGMGKIRLANEEVSDATLRTVREIGLPHVLVNQAGMHNKPGEYQLPKSADEITSIGLSKSKITDAGLKELAALKNLTSLWLDDTRVTDMGMKELAGLKKLDSLSLYGTKVTSVGLKDLAGLKLKWLVLSNYQKTDATLRSLREIDSLNALLRVQPGRNQWTAGFDYAHLDLDFTTVTDAGLKELAGLTGMQSLTLNGNNVTDVGLKELAALKDLQILNLQGTKVTDAGLKELAGLKKLKELNLAHTKVTDAGIQQLRAALPSIGCIYDQSGKVR